jgi:hypothetical protein
MNKLKHFQQLKSIERGKRLGQIFRVVGESWCKNATMINNPNSGRVESWGLCGAALDLFDAYIY